jgi:hypothetical protein
MPGKRDSPTAQLDALKFAMHEVDDDPDMLARLDYIRAWYLVCAA